MIAHLPLHRPPLFVGIDMIDADSPLEVLSGGPQELRGASFSSISTWSSVHLQVPTWMV